MLGMEGGWLFSYPYFKNRVEPAHFSGYTENSNFGAYLPACIHLGGTYGHLKYGVLFDPFLSGDFYEYKHIKI